VYKLAKVTVIVFGSGGGKEGIESGLFNDLIQL